MNRWLLILYLLTSWTFAYPMGNIMPTSNQEPQHTLPGRPTKPPKQSHTKTIQKNRPSFKRPSLHQGLAHLFPTHHDLEHEWKSTAAYAEMYRKQPKVDRKAVVTKTIELLTASRNELSKRTASMPESVEHFRQSLEDRRLRLEQQIEQHDSQIMPTRTSDMKEHRKKQRQMHSSLEYMQVQQQRLERAEMEYTQHVHRMMNELDREIDRWHQMVDGQYSPFKSIVVSETFLI